jgi:DNA-binding response OmpR family regulator
MIKTVLIVEDEYMIAMDLQFMLEANGWRIMEPVGSVQEALHLLDGELLMVALLDVNLGTELVTPVALALKTLGIPFAVASAYDRPEQYGGDVLRGVPNAGKPTNERRVLAVLAQLSAL